MKVCMDVRKLFDSGIGTYIRGLLYGFSELQENPDWSFIARADDVSSDLLKSTGGSIHVSRAGEYTISELFSISRIANHTSSDLFHAPHYVVPFRLKPPLVVTIHDLIHLKFPEYFSLHKRAYARWMIGRAVKKASAVLTVSECTKKDLIENFGIEAEKIDVCYEGVNGKYYSAVSEESLIEFRSKYNLPSDYLLFVGNLKPHKNVFGLIDAWSSLPDSIRPALVIVGEKIDEYVLLKHKIRDLDREGEVRFIGSLSTDDLVLMYHSCSAYMQPSWYEGFGLPPIEAMASKIPVAVSNRGSLPEIAGDAALVFDPGNREQFIQTLETLLTDSEQRRILMERGLKRAGEFQWRKTAAKTFEVYRRVVGK